ncbi:uncharacterized protein LOC112054870 [Bicyclus anynana]|uniref:Uncharacterized protein LOC112054870 n=1 Tax=Bicyclus anynana TaxID=110368 RepID=A0A6J1NS75_BICAN|nr:uncharacterized protein LOC112054870 [Bicyclus anynana]XP_023950565.2 uncharacterized protein LOC112054870 [Bicyclus anynana]
MKCCVLDCETTAENVVEKTKPEAITVSFHDFPSDTNTRNLWLKSLCIKDPLPEDAKICSLHFLDDELQHKDGITKISDGAIPITLQFCTMCLDSQNMLYSMTKYKLEDIYKHLTGKPVFTYKHMKPAVCMTCLESLVDMNKFRLMGLKSRAILAQFGM